MDGSPGQSILGRLPGESAVVDSESRWLQRGCSAWQVKTGPVGGAGAGPRRGRGTRGRGQVLGCLRLSKGSRGARGAGSSEQRAHPQEQVRTRERWGGGSQDRG